MPEEAVSPLRALLAQFVLEGLPEPVLILNSAGALIDANRSARSNLSEGVFELFRAGRRTSRMDVFFRELGSSGRASLEIDHPVRGTLATQQLSLDGIRLEQSYVVRVRDVTEQRALERELAQLRRGAMSGFLAATVMHDFNNLLTPILDWTTRLARELDRDSPAGSLAVDLESLTGRAAMLLRDARSLTEPRSAEPVALDLNQAVRHMQPLIERLFAANMELEFALDEGVGSVRVDRGGLEHALLNLLVNARNALPGAGHVTISTRAVPAEFADTPRFVSLSVRDTGRGMTEEVCARAFDEFFTTGAAAGGTGLGLASVRRFARESGGTVTLDSAPARGTTVTLLLPCAVPARRQ